MALQKIEINNGAEVKYWRVAALLHFNPDEKIAVIGVKGYVDEAAREAGTAFKMHEFLIKNCERVEQDTRPATLEEKKALLVEKLPSDQFLLLTDEQIEEMPYDIVTEERRIPLPYFDTFKASMDAGEWVKGAYDYLKSGAYMTHEFFDDATDV